MVGRLFSFCDGLFSATMLVFREGTWNQTGVWCNFDSQFQPAGQQAWQPWFQPATSASSLISVSGPYGKQYFWSWDYLGNNPRQCQKTKFLSHRVLYLGKAALVLSYMFFFASVLIDKGAKLKTPSRRSIWHSCLLVCVFLCFALIS